MKTFVGRGLVAALIAVFGCLLLAVPASAQTTTVTEFIHAGTLDWDLFSSPGYEVIFDLEASDHTCADPEEPPRMIWFHYNESMILTAVERVLLGDDKGDDVGALFFDLGGNEYQLDLSLGDPGEVGFGTNGGTVSGTHPNQTLTQHILLLGSLLEVEGDCEKGEEICLFAVELTLSGSYDGTTMHIGPLSGSGTPVTAFCNAPFASMDSGSMDVTGLTLDDTAP